MVLEVRLQVQMGGDVNQVHDLEDVVDCYVQALAIGQVQHGELENVHVHDV